MVVTGPWNLGEFRRRLPPDMQDRWSTAPLPAPDAESGYPGLSLAGGSSLVVLRGAADNDGAWRLLEFLSEPAQQARFYELSGDLPARRSAWPLTDLDQDPRAAAFRQQLDAVVSMPKVPEWEQIATRVAARAEEVIRGARSLDSALAALDAEVDRILEKRRWMLDRAARAGGAARLKAGLVSAAALRGGGTRESRAAWLFLAPALVAIVLFFAVPVVAGFLLSFTDFDLYAIADPPTRAGSASRTTRGWRASRCSGGRWATPCCWWASAAR